MKNPGERLRIFSNSDGANTRLDGGQISPSLHHHATSVAIEDVSADSIQVDLVGNGKSIIFRSFEMQQLIAIAKKIARSDAAVLITGESGTGKEMISRLIHQESQRARQQYVAINCAAMPESLAESLFFGHERGSFTGAFQGRVGQFQYAHKGSILLDEISEIPLTMQAKLLRVLEEQEVLKIGSLEPEKIDVRIIATSNRDLQQAIRQAEFRADLYHRLGTLKIEIPPLRQRPADISALTEHFLIRFCQAGSIAVTGIASDAENHLRNYDWPGNVRELRNVIHAACVLTETSVIQSGTIVNLIQSELVLGESSHESLPTRLDEIEKNAIIDCLNRHEWNKASAAEELGVTARTLSNKLKLYQQQHPQKSFCDSSGKAKALRSFHG